MPEVQKVSVALTAEQVVVLKSVVDSGEYATTSEVVREAIRDWQRKRELHGLDIDQMRQLWAKGKQSGPAQSADLARVRRTARERLQKATIAQPHHAD